MADNNSSKTLNPKIVLGVGAHPDDLDFIAAGSFATWVAEGSEVYYLILTNGNKGSADPSTSIEALIETRQQEQRAAAAVLGIKDVIFLDYDDGSLEASMDLKRDICRVIRQLQPDVVVTFDPTQLYNAELGLINHPDHRAAGQATLDAVYPLARDYLSFPELYTDEHLKPQTVSTLLLSNYEKQNYFVDITEHLDNKIAAMHAHESQISDARAVAERIRQVAESTGTAAGCAAAEGFVRIDVRVW